MIMGVQKEHNSENIFSILVTIFGSLRTKNNLYYSYTEEMKPIEPD